MIFSYLVHLVILRLIWCIHLPDEKYPKGSVAKPAYHHIQTTKQISNELTSDVTKIANENYFPGVIYPTSILDVAQPFFYRVNAQDQVLGPFSDDVKSSYKLISSKTGDSKNINNYLLKNMSQSQENLDFGTENDGHTCSEPSSKENEDNEEILSQLSNENINKTFEDKIITNSRNTGISSITSANETDSVADVEENIASSHVENVLKNTSDEGGDFFENLEIPIEESVYEVYTIISDLKGQEVIQDNNVTLNSKNNLTNETNEGFLEKDFNSKNIDHRQNIFLDNYNLTSNEIIVMNLNETLPPLPVGCFESRNVTSDILTKSTEESTSALEESLNMSSKISCSNNTMGNLVYNETDLHLEKLLLRTLENDTYEYSDYDHNCTDVNNDGPGSEDDSDDFFLDMIISLDSISEMNDTTSPNKDNETNLIEIPIIDRTNTSLHNVNASQENVYKY